ncbi:MAG: alpha/beta hydrolase, partial [Leeuwenhoekiella sp.]
MQIEEQKHYIKTGTGKKVIVFIHYFGGDAGSWKWMGEHLKKDCTCYFLNLPGFNNTTPLETKTIAAFSEYINEAISHLNLEHYILCGHSMGAKLVAYAAATSKNPPERLILIAPSPPTVEKMPSEEKERMLKHPNKDEAIKTVKGVCVQQLDEERFNYGVNSQLAIEDKTWDWWLEKGMGNDVSDIIKTGNTPATVICSQDDPVIPMEWIENEVKPYFKDLEVVVYKDLGHLIPMEAPRKLATTI